MKIYVTQIYIETGMSYRFSHNFQNWLSEQLTSRVQPSPAFVQTYGKDFNLVFNMSAKSKIADVEIKGPTVFERTKDVEFSIFLPHAGCQPRSPDGYRQPLNLLLQGITDVLERFGMDTSEVVNAAPTLIEHIIWTPEMFKPRTTMV